MLRWWCAIALGALGCAESSGTDPGLGGQGGSAGASAAGTGGASVDGGGSGGAGATNCQNLLLAAESPGGDGVYGSDDDVIVHADLVQWGAVHVDWSLRTQEPGADGKWGTADDLDGQLSVYDWNPDGKISQGRAYEAEGPDGQWRTADDVLFAVTSYDYSSATKAVQLHTLAGDDHFVGTADDGVSQWLDMTLEPDPAGTSGAVRVKSALYHTQPGPDGQWQTSDDPVSFGQRHEYPEHALRQIFMVAEPGPDGSWWTADDVETTLIVSACNPELGFATDKFYTPGPDGDLETADDVLASEWYYRLSGCGEARCALIVR